MFLLKLQWQIWRCTSLFISWDQLHVNTTFYVFYGCLHGRFFGCCVYACVWCFFLTRVSRVVYASVWIVHSQQRRWLRTVVHTCEVMYRGCDQCDSTITLAPPGFYVRPYECVYVCIHGLYICAYVLMYICMYICICMYKWCVCTYGWAGLSAVAVAHNVGATMEARNLWVSLPPLFIKAEFSFRCYRWAWLCVCVCVEVCVNLNYIVPFPWGPIV